METTTSIPEEYKPSCKEMMWLRAPVMLTIPVSQDRPKLSLVGSFDIRVLKGPEGQIQIITNQSDAPYFFETKDGLRVDLEKQFRSFLGPMMQMVMIVPENTRVAVRRKDGCSMETTCNRDMFIFSNATNLGRIDIPRPLSVDDAHYIC